MSKTAFTAAAFAAIVLAGAANAAVTITQSTVGPDTGPYAGETVIATFDTTANLSNVTNAGIRTGSQANVSAAPLGDTTSYLSIQGNGGATLALGGDYNSLSFYWGSIDRYNTVAFFDGATLLGSFTGDDVPAAPANGNQTIGSDNRRVQFDFGGATANSVRFTSTSNAFELDTVAGSAVPEPATWALMLTGFGLVGSSLRRRNRAVVTA